MRIPRCLHRLDLHGVSFPLLRRRNERGGKLRASLFKRVNLRLPLLLHGIADYKAAMASMRLFLRGGLVD